MAIARTIYTAGYANIVWTADQEGITCHNGETPGTAALPSTSLVLQSVDWSKDTPKENITSFGTSAFERISNEAESAEIELECYPSQGIGSAITKLANTALAEQPTYVNVVSNAGSVNFALLSSFEFEASMGDVPTMSMTFMGNAGTPEGGITPETTLAALANVGTTAVISIGLKGSGGTANAEAAMFNAVFPQSASFSWDAGVESVGRLGNPISKATYFGNPPGEASIDCEGLASPGAVQWVYLFSTNLGTAAETYSGTVNTGGVITSASQPLTIGARFIGNAGDTSSESVSIAVGELFGTFSTTTEGTAQGVIIG